MFKYYNFNTSFNNIFNDIHYSNENGDQQHPEDILFIRQRANKAANFMSCFFNLHCTEKSGYCRFHWEGLSGSQRLPLTGAKHNSLAYHDSSFCFILSY